MKLAERKQKYRSVMALMLKGENKKAFEELAVMCGEDTGLFVLADYDKVMADLHQAKELK